MKCASVAVGATRCAAATARPSSSASASSISPGFSQTVEGLALVETPHLDGPFDRLAFAADHKPAICLAVWARRHGKSTGAKARLTVISASHAALPFPKRGKIEKWKAHRALDLECPVAGQKNQGRVGVDAFDRGATMVAGSLRKSITGCCISSLMPQSLAVMRTSAREYARVGWIRLRW